ncbi:Major Facilitator Superfamily protein [Pseudonocardia ammonioxydans]|uniref:Major Facilitator Superfamily protein n=1 Tax=Pseudonocardia ammonioxydans TaxID=260086 RepID=A0A1I5BBJ4_PSUAM|nr:MFS transporter [Pseudonocardia ammonioxydans]SFN72083.1 Major Facilitator Superfamily protein [Pseudonocardia ammonioxydans]
MSSTSTAARPGATPRRAAVASLIGTTIEWYDFYLYATAAALVFAPLFFTDVNPAAGVLASFATYAAGFGARPIGAVVAGHLGDRVGRRTVLVGSLVLMGAATTLIGLLPTYPTAGLLAPILLVVLRLLQGLAVGAEWAGAVLMAVEHAEGENHERRRGFYGSFPQIGSSAGMLLASGVYAAVLAIAGKEAFLAGAWRIPFLLSFVLVVVGLAIRLTLADPAVFTAARDSGSLAKQPVLEVLRTEWRTVLLAVGTRIAQNSVYILATTFALTYLAQGTDAAENAGLTAVIVASAIGLFSTPLWAILSDRVGRKPVYLVGAIGAPLFLGAFFLLLDSGSTLLIVVAMLVLVNLFHDAMYGPQAAWYGELFDTRVRYSGASLGYQIGSVIGGTTPLVATALLMAGGGRPWLIWGYFGLLFAICIVSTVLAPETLRTGLRRTPEREELTV